MTCSCLVAVHVSNSKNGNTLLMLERRDPKSIKFIGDSGPGVMGVVHRDNASG